MLPNKNNKKSFHMNSKIFFHFQLLKFYTILGNEKNCVLFTLKKNVLFDTGGAIDTMTFDDSSPKQSSCQQKKGTHVHLGNYIFIVIPRKN